MRTAGAAEKQGLRGVSPAALEQIYTVLPWIWKRAKLASKLFAAANWGRRAGSTARSRRARVVMSKRPTNAWLGLEPMAKFPFPSARTWRGRCCGAAEFGRDAVSAAPDELPDRAGPFDFASLMPWHRMLGGLRFEPRSAATDLHSRQRHPQCFIARGWTH